MIKQRLLLLILGLFSFAIYPCEYKSEQNTRIHRGRMVHTIVFILRNEACRFQIKDRATKDIYKEAAIYQCYSRLEQQYFEEFRRYALPIHNISIAARCMLDLKMPEVKEYEEKYVKFCYKHVIENMRDIDRKEKEIEMSMRVDLLQKQQEENVAKRLAYESLLHEFRRAYPRAHFSDNSSLSFAASLQKMLLQ